MKRPRLVFVFLNLLLFVVSSAFGQEVAPWKYSPELLHPFWLSEVIQSEPVLFIRDAETKEARGSLIFPIEDVVVVTNAAGDITYQEGVDYRFQPGTREIIVPCDSVTRRFKTSHLWALQNRPFLN